MRFSSATRIVAFAALSYWATPAAANESLAATFAAVRSRPAELRAFLSRLPKGGELHTHFGGALTTRRLLELAAQAHTASFFVRVPVGTWTEDDPKAFAFVAAAPGSSPQAEAGWTFRPARELLAAADLQTQSVVRDLDRAHTIGAHTVDPHGVFYRAIAARRGAVVSLSELQLVMMADLVRDAREQRLIYVEPQLFPFPLDPFAPGGGLDHGMSLGAGRDHLRALLAAAAAANAELPADQRVTVRPRLALSRTGPGMYSGLPLIFELASGDDEVGAAVAGLDLLGNEYSDRPAVGQHLAPPSAFDDYLLTLTRLYPGVQMSLHAGETREWDWHVRESVLAGAERLGHAVNIGLHRELGAPDRELLARRRVLVEACLTSNQLLLGLPISEHPFLGYLRAGIPVALSTDDAGVFATTMTEELARAVEAHPDLRFEELLALLRASLEHAFAPPAVRHELVARWEAQLKTFAAEP